MKRIILLMIICLPVFAFGQKTYNVTGISKSYIGLSGIGKTDMTITVEDSTFTSVYKDKQTIYKITKKVDSTYFKISDGLKEYIIKISEQKIRKYSGIIVEETDMGNIILYYK